MIYTYKELLCFKGHGALCWTPSGGPTASSSVQAPQSLAANGSLLASTLQLLQETSALQQQQQQQLGASTVVGGGAGTGGSGRHNSIQSAGMVLMMERNYIWSRYHFTIPTQILHSSSPQVASMPAR
jgi:hypothetical protein